MNVSYYPIPNFSWATCFVSFLVWCLLKLWLCLKKNFTRQFLSFSFCLYGLADICHTPRFFHCVHQKVVSWPLVFFVITPFCLVWFCCCLPLHALSFVFYLVWCSGWEVYPLFCHRRPCVLAAVVWEVWLLCPSIFTFMGKSHASQQGWKTASSTAPFLNASRRICGHVALLCPLLWSPLLHSCNLVGSFLLCTFLPRLNVLHGSSGIPDRPVWACSLLVPCGSVHSITELLLPWCD